MHTHHSSHAGHAHAHADLPLQGMSRVLWVGVALNCAYVVVELAVGLWLQSLSLVADAGHNLMDVLGVLISLLAFRLLRLSPNNRYTYGYRKTTILASLLNAVILLVTVGAIGVEAVRRLIHPQPIVGIDVAMVAGTGIVVNGISAWLFYRYQRHDLNIRSAFLHMFADALVSVGVAISGLLMMIWPWYWLDPVVSLIIAAVILYSTWGLLRESLRLSLDGVPSGLNIQDVVRVLRGVNGVKSVHHVHIWAMSTLENAITAHVVVDQDLSLAETDQIRKDLERAMQDMHIQHSTFEMETPEQACAHGDCISWTSEKNHATHT